MKKKRPEFPSDVKRKVIERSGNRCERCGIDFDDDFKGEFYHIKSVVFKEDKAIDNCSLLCRDCHCAAPNIKNEEDLILYKYYFLRFASFKEAAKYYRVDNRISLYVKLAKDIAENHYK
ncbi:MAG: HNH endonuclease [Thermoplasmatales archaeon]|nr:HNH endonuclease [Thermoplasmatales archaeon]MCK4995263.1 HNH endonuclease [Thermoplasmatales archaeon]